MLLVAWAVVLMPAMGFTGRKSPVNGVRRFEDTMGKLGGTRPVQRPGRWVMVPAEMGVPQRRRNRLVRRRRQTFMRLLAAAGATLLLGLLPSLRALLIVHLGLDVALVLYVLQLKRWRREEAERAKRADASRRVQPLAHIVAELDDQDDLIADEPPVRVRRSS